MTLTLHRISQNNYGTFGILYDGDTQLCMTCEQPWKDNAPGVSCIPAGVYECVPHDTPKFPGVWELTGVPGRSAILIHSGNTVKDTHGCILVGSSFLRQPDMTIYGVSGSRAALYRLRDYLPDEFTLAVEAVPSGGA